MRFRTRALLLLIALTFITGRANAQSTTGAIRGHVADAQGLALPGTTVTAISPSLQGVRSTVSSENGDFVLTELPPGVYTIKFDLTGFQAQEKQISLAAMQVLPVDAELGIASQSETIQVVGRSADLQTGTAQVAVTFSQELISTLPTTRDLNATLLEAPAVHPTGPSGAYSIAGSTSFESLFMVNGVAITENLRGTPFNLYIEDAVQETVVAVAGISAEYGRFGGGIANVITKSGGNDFSGSFRDTYNNDKWRALSPFEKNQLAADPTLKDTRISLAVPAYEYTFGGPVAKDKLWFFTAGRVQTQSSGRTLNVTKIPYTYSDKTRRYEAKGTYSATPTQRVQLNFLKIQEDEENYTFGGASSASMDLRSLGTRKSPQSIYSFSYNGILTPKLSLEARYSARNFSFIGAGAKSTDPIEGTLMIDLSRAPAGRYWSDTFCGVCTPEDRDNQELYVKGSYFLSSPGTGTHSMVFGYDNFDDIRKANNHQSGSDFRILGTSVWLDGTAVTPRIFGANSSRPDTTLIQTSFIPLESQGSNFRTHSLFFNDSWRVGGRITANLGIRWDKNHGLDQAGALVVKDGAFSPRLGVVWDPRGDGVWTVSGNFAKYVAAISNTIADSSSAAGNTQTFLYYYRGPSINETAPVVSTPQVIAQVLAWYQANKNSLVQEETPSIPGLTPKIGSNLSSPYVYEYSTGVARQLGTRASVRLDGAYRDYKNPYASVIDGSTGTVSDPFGQKYDLALIENTDILKRRYAGLTSQGTYRLNARTQVGGQYTLSRTWGNYDGENVASGPIPSPATQYPEYKQEAWAFPTGDLQVDQRHRSRLWINYGVPRLNGLTLSLLQTLESGVPYGANNLAAGNPNGVNPRPYVTGAPAYVNPPTGTNTYYFYTARDAFRTEGQKRTDLAINYAHDLHGVRGLRRLQLFGQAQVVNLFNQSQLCGCGQNVFLNGGSVTQTNIDTTVRTSVSNASLYAPFNPFTTVPVRGTNWELGPAFGTARNRFAYTSPRQFRMSFGVRF